MSTTTVNSAHISVLDPEIRVDSATLINLSRKHNAKIINALELEQQKADVTELLKSAQRTQSILVKCASDFGDLSGTNVKVVEQLYNEMCKYEKKIEQLKHMGTLVRFITQSRLRRQLDQLSNIICVQAEALEKYIKEFKVSQLVGDETDEFTSLVEEIYKREEEKKVDKKLDSLRRSFDELKKIKDDEVKKKLDSMLSLVKDHQKKTALLSCVHDWKVKPSGTVDKDSVITVTSKLNDETEQTFSDFICARSTSTYPTSVETHIRDGDPICDQYGYTQLDNTRTLVTVADGCGWGTESYEAAQMNMRRHQDLIHSTRDAAELILRAYQAAHNLIVQGRNEETLFMAGTTTMLAGVVLELETPESGKNFVFIFASIGDCKAYCYSPKTDTVQEITVGNRGGVDAKDPGGRLGPNFEGGAPDLRNLILYGYLCEEGDIIFIVSDGVHDNVGSDPRQLGKQPKDIGIDVESWDNIKEDLNKYKRAITDWSEKYINSLLTRPVSVASINRALLKNSVDVTQPMRTFMEQNLGKRVPPDYNLYPGKVDHTTCLSFKVGVKKTWTSAKAVLNAAAASSPATPTSSPAKPVDLKALKQDPLLSTSESALLDLPCVLNDMTVPATSSPSTSNYGTMVVHSEDDSDPYTAVWDKLFGNDAYVVEWGQFIAGLSLPLKEQSEKQLKMILDNSRTGSVNRFKFSEFLKGFGPLEHCIENVNRVISAEWFFGFISADEGKKFLELSPVGTFLIRFSGSKPGSFVLDYVPSPGKVISVRLNSHLSGGFSAMTSGGKDLVFKSLHEVVETYKAKNVLTHPFSSTLPNTPWFYGDLTGEEADQLLHGKEVGTFLIRFSSKAGCFAASFVANDSAVKRGLITKHPHGYQVEGTGTVYKTLEEIVQFYLSSGTFMTPFVM